MVSRNSTSGEKESFGKCVVWFKLMEFNLGDSIFGAGLKNV